MLEQKNGIDLFGCGFGTYRERTFLQLLKNAIPVGLLNSLFPQHNLSEKVRKSGLEILDGWNMILNFDSAKQMLSADQILKYLKADQIKSIAIIGDGYGFMTCLMKKLVPHAKIFCVNLGKILFSAAHYTLKVLPDVKFALLRSESDFVDFDQKEIIFVEAE